MDEWQKGFELDHLKAFAAPFKARHKALVFGAFGLTKERDIADALAQKRAIWTGTPPQAVALFAVTKMASEQSDFAQRKWQIPPGSISVKAFAALDAAAGEKVLAALLARAGGAPVWLEIFEDRRCSRCGRGDKAV